MSKYFRNCYLATKVSFCNEMEEFCRNKNINYDFFLNCLDILLDLSETLRIRIGQKEINHDKQNEQKQVIKDDLIISRCSLHSTIFFNNVLFCC